MVERLASPAAHELDALTDLWERSVRATHDFLAPEDIPFFRRMVRQEALPAAEIYVIRDSGNGFAAFAGIGADRLEMLFVAPFARGKGLGRELVEHVAVHCGVRRVDVNEQTRRPRDSTHGWVSASSRATPWTRRVVPTPFSTSNADKRRATYRPPVPHTR